MHHLCGRRDLPGTQQWWNVSKNVLLNVFLAFAIIIMQKDFSLKLESLEARRVKADLVLCYKIVHGHIDIDK